MKKYISIIIILTVFIIGGSFVRARHEAPSPLRADAHSARRGVGGRSEQTPSPLGM